MLYLFSFDVTKLINLLEIVAFTSRRNTSMVGIGQVCLHLHEAVLVCVYIHFNERR